MAMKASKQEFETEWENDNSLDDKDQKQAPGPIDRALKDTEMYLHDLEVILVRINDRIHGTEAKEKGELKVQAIGIKSSIQTNAQRVKELTAKFHQLEKDLK